MVKRRIIIGLAVVAAVSGVLLAAVLSRSAAGPRGFGQVPEVCIFDAEPEALPISSAEGDTDRLLPLSYESPADVGGYVTNVRFLSPDGKTYSAGSGRYVDGRASVLSPAPDNEFGYIEKRSDGGGWEFYSELTYLTSDIGTGTSVQVFRESMPVCLPNHDPGEYRVTYSFRELRDGTTVGDELYSVSHTYSVPEASGSPCDVLSVKAALGGFLPADWRDGRVTLRLRGNGGAAPWLDTGSIGWEMKNSSGRWEDVPAPEDGASAEAETSAAYARECDTYCLICGDVFGCGDAIASYPALDVHIPERDAEYRLTLRFTENGDGSGGEYVLSLVLGFDG